MQVVLDCKFLTIVSENPVAKFMMHETTMEIRARDDLISQLLF